MFLTQPVFNYNHNHNSANIPSTYSVPPFSNTFETVPLDNLECVSIMQDHVDVHTNFIDLHRASLSAGEKYSCIFQ